MVYFVLNPRQPGTTMQVNQKYDLHYIFVKDLRIPADRRRHEYYLLGQVSNHCYYRSVLGLGVPHW
jgi:hypothetical protein